VATAFLRDVGSRVMLKIYAANMAEYKNPTGLGAQRRWPTAAVASCDVEDFSSWFANELVSVSAEGLHVTAFELGNVSNTNSLEFMHENGVAWLVRDCGVNQSADNRIRQSTPVRLATLIWYMWKLDLLGDLENPGSIFTVVP